MTIRRRPEATQTECTFVCPDCVTPVIQPLSDRMVPVLIGAGCAVEPWEEESAVATAQALHPSVTGQITESEIACFIADLEQDGWMDELLQ